MVNICSTQILLLLFLRKMNQSKGISSRLEKYSSRLLFLESYFLAHSKSSRPKANTARIENFAENNAILQCGIATSREYGRIKQQLLQKGQPIPENDIWIAALAIEHGITLVTRDEHFKKIDELKRTVW